MAVLMILDWKGVSAGDYERVNEQMGVRSDADAPGGLITHTAAVTEDGELVVVDLWESEQALRRFAEARLMPAVRELELPQSQPRILPVHNRVRGSAEEANVLILLELPDADTAAYDRMTADMPGHATTDGAHPAHDHVAAVDGDTLVVADIWPSMEAFGQFADEEIGPAAGKHGVDVGSMRQRTGRVHNRLEGRKPAEA